MDSFSKTSKLEILEQQIDPINCGIPLLFGLFISSSSYDEKNNAEITTDIEQLDSFIIKNIRNILKNYQKIQKNQGFDIKNTKLFDEINLNNSLKDFIETKNSFKINKKNFYKITIKNSLITQIFSLFDLKENLLVNITLISKNLDGLRAFVKGVYLGSATSSIKISNKPNEKVSNGYHLEFDSKNLSLLREISHIISQFDIFAKLIERKNNFVLYIKDAENVSDLLALVGANNSVLILQNEIVKREFRNKINRQTNCVSGNISKTVEASMKQLDAIDKIDKKIGLNSLPLDLEEVALMRMANPEEPLDILLKLSNIPLTKSGLNHRLRKIISIADKLEE
ncbi:MAG: DNA-binding protein WhiA [Clostridia bacterium]|nr:DNA-binding protein WhiA [Clostridia bacterium]